MYLYPEKFAELIKKLEFLGNLYTSDAQYHALESARKPLDAELRQKAERLVFRMDLAKQIAAVAIDHVRECWPTVEDARQKDSVR